MNGLEPDFDTETATFASTDTSGRRLPLKSNKFNIREQSIDSLHNVRTNIFYTKKSLEILKLITYWQDLNFVFEFRLPNENFKLKFYITKYNVEYCNQQEYAQAKTLKHTKLKVDSDNIYLIVQAKSPNELEKDHNFKICIGFGAKNEESIKSRDKLMKRITSYCAKKRYSKTKFNVHNMIKCTTSKVLFEQKGYSQYFLDKLATRSDIRVIFDKIYLYITANPRSRRHKGREMIIKVPLVNNIWSDYDKRNNKIICNWARNKICIFPKCLVHIVLGYATSNCKLKVELGDLADQGKYHYCNIGYDGVWWSLLFKIKGHNREKFCNVIEKILNIGCKKV